MELVQLSQCWLALMLRLAMYLDKLCARCLEIGKNETQPDASMPTGPGILTVLEGTYTGRGVRGGRPQVMCKLELRK